MKTKEKTFVRGPSPSYSDEASAMSSFQNNPTQQEIFDGKLNYVGNGGGAVRKGRKTFAFWTVVVVLLVLTVGDILLTLTMFGVLHFGKGIRGMEFIPEEFLIKFCGSTDLDHIYSKGVGQIDGFTDIPVSIEGSEVQIRLNRNTKSYNRLTMDKDEGIHFNSINNFEIKDPNTGKVIFTTTHRPHYNMPKGAEALVTKTISASRVSSPLNKKLLIESDNRVSIKGSEGISVDGSNILMQAEHSLSMNASQIILQADDGICLDMDKIPIVSSEFGLRTGNVQYKICVCMPQGRLFRIAIPRVHNGPKITCAHFSSAFDPCGSN